MVITEEMNQFFRENGYVIVKQAVPKESCDQLIQVMWQFTGKSPDDPDGWYTPAQGMDEFWGHQGSGMLPLFNHQLMWDHRQNPRVYEAFCDLLGQKELWVSLDRVNLKPPKRQDHPDLNQHFIHWDRDTSKIRPPFPYGRALQGVLCLADTGENQGGFQCVPQLYRDLEEWLANQPSDRNPTVPDLTGYTIEKIAAEAGDFIIWDSLLAHGNGENLSDKPRFAQYITMSPAHPHRMDYRKPLVDVWQQNAPLPGFPIDPRGWEKAHYPNPPHLTELGRKLLGVDSWWS